MKSGCLYCYSLYAWRENHTLQIWIRHELNHWLSSLITWDWFHSQTIHSGQFTWLQRTNLTNYFFCSHPRRASKVTPAKTCEYNVLNFSFSTYQKTKDSRNMALSENKNNNLQIKLYTLKITKYWKRKNIGRMIKNKIKTYSTAFPSCVFKCGGNLSSTDNNLI